MNFTLGNPGDLGYNKIMMQRHLEPKRRKLKENMPLVMEPLVFQDKKVNEGLPRAGQSLLKDSWINKPVFQYDHSPRNRQMNEESQKMKRLYKDELRETLQQQMSKKAEQIQRNRKISKVMSVQNGMMDYLQKQIEKRDNFIKKCLVYQQACQNTFIDQNQLKTKRLQTHISQNYNPNLFSIEAENYQKIQKINLQKAFKHNNLEAENQRTKREYQKGEYVRYLEKGYVKESHNPITNPIEYHIENKYFKSKLDNY